MYQSLSPRVCLCSKRRSIYLPRLNLKSNIVPSVPTLPATTAPHGWNDPPPVTSIVKPKHEPAADGTISHPIFRIGVVKQPAVRMVQPFDASYMASVHNPNEYTESYARTNSCSICGWPATDFQRTSYHSRCFSYEKKDKCLRLHRMR